ncbi:hypothetical protein FKW77_005702 [Venturia effusa]|uniref:Uncharacterized protein n=1 Tax=Venturia effusa TaxID=50376 RepID=A0A517LIT1_9PEZI|nr:hypothetical protein FKW77_005702 [Venturia effusa]
MKISHLRYLLWLFYVMPPALGRPTPPPPPPPPDHVHEPPAEDDCPQQDPPVFFQTQADEFAIDIAIASRNDERTWTNVSGYFRVVVNPTSHTIRSVGSEIYQVTGPPGRDRQRISPTFTPYIAHAYRTPTQSIYADRWEIGIDSEEEATNSLSNSFRALANKIHPQLPLTPRESSQLLSILTTSFNKQLDIHHPTSLSSNAVPSSQRKASGLSSLRHLSAAVSANDHLDSLLSSPLLSKKPRSASFSKSNFEAIATPFHLQRQLGWLEDRIASATVTLDDFVVTLRNVREALASRPETTRKAIKDLSAGSKILRWIRTSGRTSEKDIMSAGKGSGSSNFLRNTLIDVLVIQGRQDSVWHWLKYTIQIPRNSIFSRLLFAEIHFGAGVEAAMLAFLDAPNRGYHGPRSAAPIVAHCLAAAPPLSSSDSFLRFLDTLRSQPENSFACAAMPLFHPDGPSTKEGMAYVSAQSNKVMATGEIDVPQALRRRHVAFYLKLAQTLLSMGHSENAVLILRFAQAHFPRELGIEEKHLELESKRSASSSESSTSEEENLLQLHGLFAS